MSMFLDVWTVLVLVSCLDIEQIEASKMNFEGLNVLSVMEAIEKNGGEIFTNLVDQVPDWTKDLLLWYSEAVLELMQLYQTELVLLCMVLGTLIMMHMMDKYFSRSKWEVPLVDTIAKIDRKLFVSNAELAILQRELVERSEASRKDGEMIKKLAEQYDMLDKEMKASKEEVVSKEDKLISLSTQLEVHRDQVSDMKDNLEKNKQKVDELSESKRIYDENLNEKECQMMMITDQIKSQVSLCTDSESLLKDKIKENERIVVEIEVAQNRLEEIQSNHDMICSELHESKLVINTIEAKVTEMEEKEENWKNNSELIQSQLADKSDASDLLESEVSCLKSRIAVFESECESRESELNVLKETLEKELKHKNGEFAEADGWDLDADCFVGVEVEELKEHAKLRIERRKVLDENDILGAKLYDLEANFDKMSMKANEEINEIDVLKRGKEIAIESKIEAERKLEILTDYFNKKEEELRAKLGIESSKFENVSSEAEVAARKLASVTNELDITRSQVNMLSKELVEQETSLNASFLEADKKCQEHWITKKQSERRVAEMQKEMSKLRNMLTAVGEKRNISTNLLSREEDFVMSETSLSSLPHLPGMPNPSSMIPAGLPSLPILPGMPMPPLLPGVISDHFGNMSFASRRTQSMSSISPEKDTNQVGQQDQCKDDDWASSTMLERNEKWVDRSSSKYLYRSDHEAYEYNSAGYRSPSPVRGMRVYEGPVSHSQGSRYSDQSNASLVFPRRGRSTNYV